MAITRTISTGEVGQSYSRFCMEESGGYSTFMGILNAAIIASNTAIGTTLGISVATTDRVQMRTNATDGSAILQANEGGTGYWVTDALAAGALLTAVTASWGALGTKPMVICHRCGQQDAGIVATEAASDDVKAALPVIWAALRTALGTINGHNVPIFLDMIGPRDSTDEFGEYWVRDRMMELIEEAPIDNLFRGAETYPLQMGTGGVSGLNHPTDGPTGSYRLMAAWSGRKVAEWLVSQTELRGPSIASAVAVGSTVQVTITVPATKTLVKPSSPEFFGVFDSNDVRLDISGYSWAGNVLTLSVPSGAATFRYPARPTGTVTGAPMIDNVVRLSDPVDPVFTGEKGLPLESCVSISL